MRALLIRRPWIDMILDGQKTWEIRGSRTSVRGQIGLIASRTGILGGAHSVVDGLANLRNRLGDAHGQGKRPVKPAPRHAELAVNMAGSVASYLLATFEAKRS